MSINILKGVMNKKWINLIPVKDKMESSYNTVEKMENDSMSILRFNLYSYFSGKIYSQAFDGRYGKRRSWGSEIGYGLGCEVVYTTPQKQLIKKDTVLIFVDEYFEIGLASDSFLNAELIVQVGGKDVTVPILKDSLLFVNITPSPFVFYPNKQKRMKYRYSEKDQQVEILFNFPFNKNWEKFIKAEKSHNHRHQQSIEKHINDMINSR